MKEFTEYVESDAGTFKLTIKYNVDGGSHGDYYTPGEEPSIVIQEVSAILTKLDSTFWDHMEKEILDHETSYDPEDYKD